MDSLTALCLLREVLRYPDEELFELLEEERVATIVGRVEAFALGPEGDRNPVTWSLRPSTLEQWQAAYLAAFEVGIPNAPCPLQESHYFDAESSSQVIRENHLFYRHFAFSEESAAPPDSLGRQLGFLGHLLHRLAAAPSPDQRQSLERGLADFAERHLLNWLPRLRDRAEEKEVEALYRRALGCLPALVTEACRR